MRVHTFLVHCTSEAMHEMDDRINAWLEENEIEPKHVVQTFGAEQMASGGGQSQPVLITQVWY